MKLWSIQEAEVYDVIKDSGVYIPDQSKIVLLEFLGPQYDWLANEMRKRLPEDIANQGYPVWAWEKYNRRHRRPDLRVAKYHYGEDGDKMVLMELEIPDEQVLLLDFDLWCIILNNGLISFNESEDRELEEQYRSLSGKEKTEFRNRNWQRVFDLSPINNDWITRGESIQATFWSLKLDQVVSVKYFTAARRVN